jgi:hypothetical protein
MEYGKGFLVLTAVALSISGCMTLHQENSEYKTGNTYLAMMMKMNNATNVVARDVKIEIANADDGKLTEFSLDQDQPQIARVEEGRYFIKSAVYEVIVTNGDGLSSAISDIPMSIVGASDSVFAIVRGELGFVGTFEVRSYGEISYRDELSEETRNDILKKYGQEARDAIRLVRG